MDDWLSVSEVVERTGIPENTLRRYLNNHQHHLRLKRNHKQYSIHEDSVEVLTKIRGWYEQNKKRDKVDDLLNQSKIPMTITVDDGGGSVEVDVSETLADLKKGMEEQKEFNRQLLEKLDQRDKYIEERLNQRDEQLMKAMRESLESKKEIAAEKEPESEPPKKKWWEFWK